MIKKKLKKYKVLLITISIFLTFYFGFKAGINLRSHYDHKLIPDFQKYYSKYDKKDKLNIYLEGFLRYMAITKKEFRDIIMEFYFELETKPLLNWFVKDYLKGNENILDLGGATGIQWKTFYNTINNKNVFISVVDIDKFSIDWGRKHNNNNRVKFYHTNEVDKIQNKDIDTILLCQVYMQIPNANKLLKYYLDKYPKAKIILIHSAFPDSLYTKVLSFFKQYILKYTYLSVIQGRAMTDNDLYKELDRVDLKVIKEYNLHDLSYSKRAYNKLKAYIISRK